MKLIIKNETELDDAEALRRVQQVVAGGLVSGGTGDKLQYCYLTTWADKIGLWVTRSKLGAQTFRLAHFIQPEPTP